MDRGATWATVHRVAKSQTRLKSLSMHTQYIFNGLKLLKSNDYLFIIMTGNDLFDPPIKLLNEVLL